MAGEVITMLGHTTMSEVYEAGKHGLIHTKAVIAGVGATGLAGYALLKKSGGSTAGQQGHGFVRRIEQGYLGLRERNNKFYEIIENEQGEREKKFYELVTPGLLITPHPLRKYKLLNTQNQSLELEPFRIKSATERQHDIKARITWGHIKGFDDYGERLEYELDGEPISVEQLVLNGIMAAHQEHEVGEQVGGIAGNALRTLLRRHDDPSGADSAELFGHIEERCRDDLYRIGSEIRGLQLLDTENTALDHYRFGGTPGGPQEARPVDVALVEGGGLRLVPNSPAEGTIA